MGSEPVSEAVALLAGSKVLVSLGLVSRLVPEALLAGLVRSEVVPSPPFAPGRSQRRCEGDCEELLWGLAGSARMVPERVVEAKVLAVEELAGPHVPWFDVDSWLLLAVLGPWRSPPEARHDLKPKAAVLVPLDRSVAPDSAGMRGLKCRKPRARILEEARPVW